MPWTRLEIAQSAVIVFRSLNGYGPLGPMGLPFVGWVAFLSNSPDAISTRFSLLNPSFLAPIKEILTCLVDPSSICMGAYIVVYLSTCSLNFASTSFSSVYCTHRFSMLTWLLTLSILHGLRFSANADSQCFYPDGTLQKGDVPCLDSGISYCGGKSWHCGNTKKLCSIPQDETISGASEVFYRTSCTDKTWKSSECPKFCDSMCYLNVSRSHHPNMIYPYLTIDLYK